MFSPQWPQVARSQDNISPVSAPQLEPLPWDYSQNFFPFGCPLPTILANWQMASICLSHMLLFGKVSLRFVQIPWPWWMSGPEVVKKKKKKGEVVKKGQEGGISGGQCLWNFQVMHIGKFVIWWSRLKEWKWKVTPTFTAPFIAQSTLQLCWELKVLGWIWWWERFFFSREAF